MPTPVSLMAIITYSPGLTRHVDARVVLIERGRSRLDGEFAALRHSVSRVDGQVHDDLLDLPGIGSDRPELGAAAMTSSMSSPIMRVEHLAGLGDDFVEVDNLRRQHLLAAEGEELARK